MAITPRSVKWGMRWERECHLIWRIKKPLLYFFLGWNKITKTFYIYRLFFLKKNKFDIKYKYFKVICIITWYTCCTYFLVFWVYSEKKVFKCKIFFSNVFNHKSQIFVKTIFPKGRVLLSHLNTFWIHVFIF